MKTPISVIKLILENERDKNIDETTRKNYESIEEEIEKLSNGLEMALYSLRVKDFEKDFKVEDVNIVEIVRKVINENKNAFIVNSIFPKIIVDEDLIVTSDKKWIKFVIGQIISNSIKYSKVKESEHKSIIATPYPFLEVDIMKISNMAMKNIKGNLYRYIMYYLSNAFAVTIFFIFANFVFHPSMDPNSITGSATAKQGVVSGMIACQVIIVIFSVLFVGYSTSIFLKSRGKEFGLLSLYGMTKKIWND